MRRHPLHQRMSLALDRVLRNVPQARAGLRLLLRRTLVEATDKGCDAGSVRAVLLNFFDAHPLLDKFDRVSVVDGSRTSDRILADVGQWLDEAVARCTTAGHEDPPAASG